MGKFVAARFASGKLSFFKKPKLVYRLTYSWSCRTRFRFKQDSGTLGKIKRVNLLMRMSEMETEIRTPVDKDLTNNFVAAA